MTDISYPVLRTEKTDISGSVVVTPSGGSTGTPIVAADLVNGFTPITVSFAAGETSKPAIFAVADDALVEGPETYRLTMSNPLPSGTFPSGAFVEGSIGDNDSSGGGGGSTTVYGPTTTGDTGLQAVGSANMRMEHPYVNARVAGSYMLGLDGSGNGVALHQLSDSQYHLRRVTAGSVGDPSSGSDASILNGSTIAVAFADGDTLAVELVAGRVTLYKNGVAITGPAYPYDVSAVATGTNGRYVKWAGTTVTDLKIIRK